MSWIDWLEQHQMSCPSKALLGMDCPGCGMQRSMILLLKGEFAASFSMYPGLIPILATFVFLGLHLKYRFEKGAKTLTYMYVISFGIVLTNYIIKQVILFQHL
jgi:hypothetical protein